MQLVTGSKGFIGRAYCSHFPCVGVDLKAKTDCLDYMTSMVFPTVDSIIHLAAVSGILDCNKRPLASLNNNIMSTVTMLDMARVHKKKIVLASSAAVENPTNPYAAGKLAGEAIAIAYNNTYGVDYCALRFANVYGPDSSDKDSVIAKMCKDAIRENKITVYSDGEQKRDFIYIDDIVEAIYVTSTGNSKKLYQVGTGVLTSINEVAQMIKDLTSCEIEHKESPRKETTPQESDVPLLKGTTELKDGLLKTLEWFNANL